MAPLVDYQSALAAIGLAALEPVLLPLAPGGDLRPLPGISPTLPTADGFSASDARTAAMLRDTSAPTSRPSCAGSGRKVSQRVTGKSRFHNVGAFAADAPDFDRAPARLRGTLRPASRASRAGILGAATPRSDLRDIHVGRVLTLGMFLRV